MASVAVTRLGCAVAVAATQDKRPATRMFLLCMFSPQATSRSIIRGGRWRVKTSELYFVAVTTTSPRSSAVSTFLNPTARSVDTVHAVDRHSLR
jgi:hypothetical protein